ncbi:MAG: glycosyltransferase [Chloroflexota bacterium]
MEARTSGGPGRVVSRAHGSDLYPGRHRPPHIPHRARTLRGLDGLFPDSAAGAAYVASAFPWFDRSTLERMGVADPGLRSGPSRPGGFAVVSCSRIVPVKRLSLIADAVASAARQRPGVEFTWRHFGDGDANLRRELEEHTRRAFPSNARVALQGYESPAALMSAYSTLPADVFVNASSSEGTPVSLMEAASAAIPLVATAVGGNPEIVTTDSGILVSANPTPDELGDALVRLVDDPSFGRRLAEGSRAIWRDRFDAACNYSAFSARLRALVDSPG